MKQNTTFGSRDEKGLKKSHDNYRRATRAARQEYRDKVQTQLNGKNSQSMWKGLHTVMGFKGNSSFTASVTISLPDELNNFYVRFEHPWPHDQSVCEAAGGSVYEYFQSFPFPVCCPFLF